MPCTARRSTKWATAQIERERAAARASEEAAAAKFAAVNENR
ncbi:hypothetical protein ACH4L5_34330 [Streptomyces sp. NPDC017405]